MKKSVINFVFTLILALVLSMFLPWWGVMLAAFMVSAIVRLRNTSAFFVPFSAIALFWIVYALVLSSANDFILAEKIAILLPLGGNPIMLILVTGLIGGLAAGVAGVFGNQCRAAFSRQNP